MYIVYSELKKGDLGGQILTKPQTSQMSMVFPGFFSSLIIKINYPYLAGGLKGRLKQGAIGPHTFQYVYIPVIKLLHKFLYFPIFMEVIYGSLIRPQIFCLGFSQIQKISTHNFFYIQVTQKKLTPSNVDILDPDILILDSPSFLTFSPSYPLQQQLQCVSNISCVICSHTHNFFYFLFPLYDTILETLYIVDYKTNLTKLKANYKNTSEVIFYSCYLTCG